MNDVATDWIGRSESTLSDIVAPPSMAMAATLDRLGAEPTTGWPLPPLWHWLYFLTSTMRSALGDDGHAKKGGFLPPVALPRRMWAGSAFEFHHDIVIGDRLERESTISDVTEKQGSSGPLVFVKVRHELRRSHDKQLLLTEHHDIVYREAASPDAELPAGRTAPADPDWQHRWEPDPVLLFRYSALTFNGHRIHYDREYAVNTEGYPGLIVHGPLIATLLLDALHKEIPDARIKRFRFRALRPSFDIHHLFVCGQRGEDGRSATLWAQDHDGYQTMTARAEW